jgi:periplasmic copper chaperone A
MRTTLLKHAFAAAAASAAVVLVAGGIASAHIDPDPIAMQAGAAGTVAFNVEHGCEGSPTTSMKFEIPDGVTGVSAVDKEGWTSSITGDTLEYSGGPLAADEEDHFDIAFTAPAQAGDIRFPVIQTCEVGELAWIEVAEDGAAEPEHPAPTIKITEGPPTAADLTPEPEEEDEATADTVVTTGTDAVISTTVIAPPADDDSSNTGAIVGVVIGAVIVLAGGGLFVARRKKTPKTGTN